MAFSITQFSKIEFADLLGVLAQQKNAFSTKQEQPNIDPTLETTKKVSRWAFAPG
jgi:hypothetical protein